MAFGGVLAGGLAMVFLDWERLLTALISLDLLYALLAAVFVVASFVCGSLGLAALTRRDWSERIRDRGVFRITVLSQIAANLLSFGGLTGATMRARLLSGKEGRWPEAIVAATLFTFALNGTSLAISATAILLILSGLGFKGAGVVAWLVPVLTALGFALLVLRAGPWITKRAGGFVELLATRLRSTEFADQTAELLQQALGDRAAVLTTTGWLLADWFAMAFALGCAFRAVGAPIPFEVLIACFGAGALATLLSFIPGGIGVLEASMVGVAVRFGGVESELATVAVLLYRALYYGLPIPLSLLPVRESKAVEAEVEPEPGDAGDE